MSTELKRRPRRSAQRWSAAQWGERLHTDGRLLAKRARHALGLGGTRTRPRAAFEEPTAPPVRESEAAGASGKAAPAAAAPAQTGRPVAMRAAARAAAEAEPAKPVPARTAESPAPQPAAGARTAASPGNLIAAARQKLQRTKRRWKQILGEKRARHFPESNRLPIQWVLLGWGLLPMLADRLGEALLGRRKRSIHRFMATRERAENRRHLRPAVFLGAAGALAVVTLFLSFYTFGTTVTYDGEPVAAVASPLTVKSVCSDLEKVTSSTLGTHFTIDESLLQYHSGLLRRQDVVDAQELEADLSGEIGLVTQAYALYIDGDLVGATPYEGALEELLKQLKNDSTDENTIFCDFLQDVEIRQEYVPSDSVMNLGHLAELLYSTKTEEVTYTVKKGDTWSQIANSHDMTSKELLAMNPGYNVDKLSIGEVLTLSAAVPYLTLKVVQQERYVDDVPFDIVYTDSANLYKGDYKVTSAGSYGAADVVANVTYVNGEETERQILSSVTIKQPVTEQRLQGTKERPTWLPTGSFRWPTTGRITSRFGRRSSPGGIGSTNHKGIDIAGRRGTPIYAADGGTVVYAGWMSGYGYLVQINHGNGYVTYYGHNSSLTVSVGQHVYKGQQIARMGSTGNSTGNHCHFEVRYNGVAKNPLNYLH